MKDEVLISKELLYLPPSQMLEMFWWGFACILIISVGISIILSVLKESIRFFKKFDKKIESSILRILGILIGVCLISAATFYPFDMIPLTIRIMLGIIAGAHSEPAYHWLLKTVEAWIKRRFHLPSNDEGENNK
jgi:hypothetical protein